jgi:hypothetical protein
MNTSFAYVEDNDGNTCIVYESYCIFFIATRSI